MNSNYDLTQAFTLKGDWFLPEDSDTRLSGEVSYSPESGIQLELIGDFNNNPLGIDVSKYDVIQGIVEGSRQITLFNCFCIGHGEVALVSGVEIARPVLTFRVNSMLDGWLFSSIEEIKAKTVYIEFDGLSEWLCTSGFNFDGLKIDYQAKTIDLHYELPKPIDFEFPKGVKASFDFMVDKISRPVFTTSFSMQQTVRLKLQNKEGLNLDDVLHISYKFMTFLMLAMDGETFVKSVRLFNDDYSVQFAKGKSVNREVDFYYYQHFTVKEKKRDYNLMTFTYPSVCDIFKSLILKWDALFSDFESAIVLLIEQLRDKSTFTDNDFLNLAQAAATIHDRMHPDAVKMPKEEYATIKDNILSNVPLGYKEMVRGLLQYGNNVSLSQRLNELVAMCPSVIRDLFIPDAKSFVNEIRDSRNYYTHYTSSGKKNIKRGRDLMLLTKRMQVLLIVDLLLFIGVDSELLVRLYENQRYKLSSLL